MSFFLFVGFPTTESSWSSLSSSIQSDRGSLFNSGLRERDLLAEAKREMLGLLLRDTLVLRPRLLLRDTLRFLLHEEFFL